MVQSSIPSSPPIQNHDLSAVREPTTGPVRNKKGRNRKEKVGTNRGASSVKRGSSSVEQDVSSDALAERQKLCKVGDGIIVSLAAICRETLSVDDGSGVFSGNFASVEALLHYLTEGPIATPLLNLNDPDLPWKTLGLMARACQDSELENSFTQLVYWVNVMQFASQVLW